MSLVDNPQFVKEYDVFREHYEWFSQRSAAGNLTIPDTKEGVVELREFVDRWAGKTGLAEMDEGLRSLTTHIVHMEQMLEKDAIEKLMMVLEKRGDWVIGEELVKAGVHFIKIMKHAPAVLRPQLLKIHRDFMKKEFDPETFYWESEEDTEKNREEFEQAWRIYVADWPERATPELRQRVSTVQGEPLGKWKGELQTALAKLT